MSEYVFLMRHAKHERGELTERNKVADVAGRLAEWLDGRDLEVFVEHTAATEVAATARVLVEETNDELRRLEAAKGRMTLAADGDERQRLKCELREERITLGPYRPERASFVEVVKWLTSTDNDSGRARMLVANDPLAGWLAGELVDGEVPIRRGELVCFRRTCAPSWRMRWVERWRIGWTIFADEDVPAITAKIESKMNTAKALGAVITGLLVFLLQEGLSDAPEVFDWIAFLAFGTAAAGYFSSLFLYDSLLLPNGFWGSRFPLSKKQHERRLTKEKKRTRKEAKDWRSQRSEPGRIRRGFSALLSIVTAGCARVRHGRTGIERPPSPTDRVLEQAMVRIWNSIFRPATVLVGVGIASLALSARLPDVDTGRLNDTGTAVVIAVWLVLWPTALVVWISASRPRLGASD